MRVLAKKMSSLGLIWFELISVSVSMLACMIAVPAVIFSFDASLVSNPFILGFVIITELLFATVLYFCGIVPYLRYRRCSIVQAQTDGEHLYIDLNAKRKATIPVSQLKDASVSVDMPYILQIAFIRWIVINIFSERYGDVVLEVPGYKPFRMRYVAYAEDSAQAIAQFLLSL